MPCAIAYFLRAAQKVVQKQTYAALDTATWDVRNSCWQELVEVGVQLAHVKFDVSRCCSGVGIGQELVHCVQDVNTSLTTLIPSIASSQPRSESACGKGAFLLSIGSGGPGRLGCADVLGSKVLWSPLLDSRCGAIHAMDMLQLELLALPGARLSTGSKLPHKGGFTLVSKGGPM